jgi:hypothetical protein
LSGYVSLVVALSDNIDYRGKAALRIGLRFCDRRNSGVGDSELIFVLDLGIPLGEYQVKKSKSVSQMPFCRKKGPRRQVKRRSPYLVRLCRLQVWPRLTNCIDNSN